MRDVIFSADDFGISEEVNEAVEAAHCNGILSTTSLMVAAPATADAIQRARSLPDLHVGLHVVLVNGRPALPPERVPALVDRNGDFATDLAAAGVNFFFTRGVRRQLEAEIRAVEAVKADWSSSAYFFRNRGGAPYLTIFRVGLLSWWHRMLGAPKGYIFFGEDGVQMPSDSRGRDL